MSVKSLLLVALLALVLLSAGKPDVIPRTIASIRSLKELTIPSNLVSKQ